MSAVDEKKPPIKWWKIALAVSIGAGMSGYLIATTFNPKVFSQIQFTYQLMAGLLLAAVTVVIRDAAFIYKLRLSTGEKMSWMTTLRAVIMWEFGATITPKLGEVAFVIYVLKKSGLSAGRSTATLMLNSFLDNFAFVLLFTLLYFAVGPTMLASNECAHLHDDKFLLALRKIGSNGAWIGYCVLMGLTVFLYIAIFRLPHTTRKFFHGLAKWRIFRYVKDSLMSLGTEIEITAKEFNHKSVSFWLKMVAATLVNWMARYALAVALLYAFAAFPLDMLLVYARQYVIWIYMIIPITPGSSGIAEGMFGALNCEFMSADMAGIIPVVWRVYSYYLYMILGLIIMPAFLRRARH